MNKICISEILCATLDMLYRQVTLEGEEREAALMLIPGCKMDRVNMPGDPSPNYLHGRLNENSA